VQWKVKSKTQKAAVLIGEPAKASGTTAKTVRFYEAKALLPPAAGTASGYRDFSPKTIARLVFIRRGRAAGSLSPRSARSSISGTPATPHAGTSEDCSPRG